MRLKHAFHVFIDNFSKTYRLMVFKILVVLVVFGLGCAVLFPSFGAVSGSAQYAALKNAFNAFIEDISLLHFGELDDKFIVLKDALRDFKNLLLDTGWLIAIDIVCAAILAFILFFLTAVGNYGLTVSIRDRMTLRTKTSLTMAILKNIKKACLFAVIYAPLTLLYYAVCFTVYYLLIFKLGKPMPILAKLFLLSTLSTLTVALKYTFTTDWLPALIHSNLNNRAAIAYAFGNKEKRRLGTFSAAIVLVFIIAVLNAIVPLVTFGAGLLITVPAGGLIVHSYQLVNYFDNNKLKYFVDDYTIVGPKREKAVTREEFFRGEN